MEAKIIRDLTTCEKVNTRLKHRTAGTRALIVGSYVGGFIVNCEDFVKRKLPFEKISEWKVIANPTPVEKSVEEIQEQITVLRAAMAADGFVPTPDGTKLREHLYYIRLGGIQHLEWAIKTREQEADDEAQMEAELSRRGL